MTERPTVKEMVREAVQQLGSPSSNAAIRHYIENKYGQINPGTLNCQITICCVNSPSRVHYPENQSPRFCDTSLDFLFKTGRGEVKMYDPTTDGQWELRYDDVGRVVIAKCEKPIDGSGPGPIPPELEDGLPFALESHLRDFLARNITTIRVRDKVLRLYMDDNERDGVEYPTDVGFIDILAVDEQDNFVVLELKVSKGSDRVIGQIMRYMGWVKKHLANGKQVSGVIVACAIDDKLQYAASMLADVTLLEYKLRFDLEGVALV